MFDRHEGGELAIAVHCNLASNYADYFAEDSLKEFKSLILSAGAELASTVTCNITAPNAKYFIGTGKLEEIAEQTRLTGAKLVIFANRLTPAQEKNLEKYLQCRVIDKNRLILDIFALRALSFEGKLQVELAQLQYMSTRLVRGWTHLERQRGGIGLRGPGEKQLEVDRRLLKDRIRAIKLRLDKVRKHRELARNARKKANVPIISLVGYTNAGKSTLFNALVGEKVYADDKLFATLDPTLRKLELPDIGSAVLVDTVGFIRDLPHDLIESFRATLEETQNADLLVQVVDVSDVERDQKILTVNQVLEEIHAQNIPKIIVYNKIDLLPDSCAKVERNDLGLPTKVWVSASNSKSLIVLREVLSELLSQGLVNVNLRIPVEKSKIRSALHSLHVVLDEKFADNGDFLLSIRIELPDLEKIFSNDDNTWQHYLDI